MSSSPYKLQIRDIDSTEFEALGTLLVEVYSTLEGFPRREDQPAYYESLRDVGSFTEKSGARVLVALTPTLGLIGGVVYFSDIKQYGAGGHVMEEKSASAIRLLVVSEKARGKGVGKALTLACLDLAGKSGNTQIILHTTAAMKPAWGMYERLGFNRSTELDFMVGKWHILGFRYVMQN